MNGSTQPSYSSSADTTREKKVRSGTTLMSCYSVNAESVSAKTENTFISAVISGHYFVACLWLFLPRWS